MGCKRPQINSNSYFLVCSFIRKRCGPRCLGTPEGRLGREVCSLHATSADRDSIRPERHAGPSCKCVFRTTTSSFVYKLYITEQRYLQILDSQPRRKRLTTANISNKAEETHTLEKRSVERDRCWDFQLCLQELPLARHTNRTL